MTTSYLQSDDESVGSSIYDYYEYGQVSSCNISDDDSDKDPDYIPESKNTLVIVSTHINISRYLIL